MLHIFRNIAYSIKLSCHLTESAKLRALRAKNVLACQLALRAYVLTCQRALCAYVLTCQCALRAYVVTWQRASFDGTNFSFAAIVAEALHTVGKV